MKKLVLVLVLVVAAAGGYFYVNRKPAPAPVVSEEPEKFLPNFDAAQSAKMGAFITNSYYLINEKYYIIGYSNMLRVNSYHKIQDGAIVRLTADNGGWFRNYEDIQGAVCLTEGPEGAIFFVMKGEIGRMVPGQDGHSILVKGGVRTLQVVGDKLYYTKGDDSKFFRSGLDGKGEENVLDKSVFYPYVAGNFVIFQDDKDGESLHLYNMADKSDKKILDGAAYCPNIVGNWVFCYVEDKATGFSQLAGVEFKEDGSFETRVFNKDNGSWFAEIRGLHYVIIESSGSGYGSLNFNGKLVKNFGRENQSVSEELMPFGALPAWMLYHPDFRINGSLWYPFSGPYGYVRSSDGKISYSLFDKPLNFDGFFSEGSDMAKDVAKWKAEQ